MALLDISEITEALMALLDQAFAQSEVTIPFTVNVLPAPPAHLDQTGIGLYLYHMGEDAHYKNLPAPGNDPVPIRFTPMGLNLYYQLSANDIDSIESSRAINEQKMMSVAIKALRDNPEINVFANQSNNRLRISLTPIPPHEAISFWTAGESDVKLSTYYEVSAALLEPEPVRLRHSRVTAYGTHTFVHGAPRIMSSSNTLQFIPPNAVVAVQQAVSPAQVPFEQRFMLRGTGFNGDRIRLCISSPALGIEAIAHEDWQIHIRQDELSARAFRTALDAEDLTTIVNLAPGIYGLQLEVTRQRRMPDGSTRDFTHRSNQSPIAITPHIDTIQVVDAAQGLFEVQGHVFPIVAENFQVYIADQMLEAGTFGALAVGEYAVNPTPASPLVDELQFRLPATDSQGAAFIPGDHLPFRLLINGTESLPTWIQIP